MYLTHPSNAIPGAPRTFGPQKVRPSAHLTVRWELPAGVVDGVGRPHHQGGEDPQRLMVGLFRLGVASNTAGIIPKKMFDRLPKPCRDPRETLVGTVPFYAPKSVSGCYFFFCIWNFLWDKCLDLFVQWGGKSRRGGGGGSYRVVEGDTSKSLVLYTVNTSGSVS